MSPTQIIYTRKLLHTCMYEAIDTSYASVLDAYCACVLRWKGSCVTSTARGYLWEIHNIRMPNHVEIMRNALHRPTSPHAMIARATCTLTGVTSIEFSVLHMALPMLARHRESFTACKF